MEPEPPSWPNRTAVCADCRVALVENERCRPGHEVANLSDARGRRLLTSRAWDASGLHVNMPASVRGVSVPEPDGGQDLFVGVVTAEHVLPEPVTAHECVAFCVQLELVRPPGAVTLRDAPTLGFSIRGDDGSVLDIARGRIDMRLLSGHKRYVNHAFGLGDYMRALDPQRFGDQAFDPLPYDRVALGLIRPGDRVAVHNVRATIDPKSRQLGYRQLPPLVLRTNGPPIITLLP